MTAYCGIMGARAPRWPPLPAQINALKIFGPSSMFTNVP